MHKEKKTENWFCGALYLVENGHIFAVALDTVTHSVILSFRLAFLLLFFDIAKVSSLQQIRHSPSLLSLQFVSYSLFALFSFLLSLCSVLPFLFHTSVFPTSSSCTVTLFVRSLRPDEKKRSKVLLCFIWLSVLFYQLCFVRLGNALLILSTDISVIFCIAC